MSDEARARALPILLVVVAAECGHCERMRNEFLGDASVQAFLAERALVAVYDRDLGGKIDDFDGERVRARVFLSRYGVFAAPTLLFLDADGQPVAEPLVGYDNREDFRALVAARLAQARLVPGPRVEVPAGAGPAVVATLQQ